MNLDSQERHSRPGSEGTAWMKNMHASAFQERAEFQNTTIVGIEQASLPEQFWATLGDCFSSCNVPLIRGEMMKSLQNLNQAILQMDSKLRGLSQSINESVNLKATEEIIRENEELQWANLDLTSSNTLLRLSNTRLQRILSQHETRGLHYARQASRGASSQYDTLETQLRSLNNANAAAEIRIEALESKFHLLSQNNTGQGGRKQELGQRINLDQLEKIHLSLQHRRICAKLLDQQLKISSARIKSLRKAKPQDWQSKIHLIQAEHRQLMEQARSKERESQQLELMLQRWVLDAKVFLRSTQST
ncbi:hypothetical protein BZL39_K03230 [Zygosaccharomyces parabailii]|nr:hypothetical protein BZL39_K03230 [Zygosaccharomyces parabailii]CDH11953.1 uncharacterized protein ZBAI_03739 [Zygosaccharomyces bailii ISA1307]